MKILLTKKRKFVSTISNDDKNVKKKTKSKLQFSHIFYNTFIYKIELRDDDAAPASVV